MKRIALRALARVGASTERRAGAATSARRAPGILLAFALTCVGASGFAAVRPANGPVQVRASGALAAPDAPPTAYAAQRGPLTLAQATALAERRYKGRVVRAETVKQGGRTVYEIRILGSDGRVRTVRIDAKTGAFL